MHCLIPVLWIWPAVFYNRHICFYIFAFIFFFSRRDATDFCRVEFTTCMALQLTDLKVGRCSSSFLIYLPFFQPGLGAKRRPRNSPEELDRNYVVCRSSQGEGVGWGGVGWGWVGTCLPPISLFVARVLRNISLSLFCGRPKALLNVGEVEKPADPAAKQPPQREAASTCGCNKSCNCTKGPVVFSDLYSTGTRANGSLNTPDPSHWAWAWPCRALWGFILRKSAIKSAIFIQRAFILVLKWNKTANI